MQRGDITRELRARYSFDAPIALSDAASAAARTRTSSAVNRNIRWTGTVAAALLWLVGSAGFSFYVARFASYNKTYGSLGAVVVLLMWFYVSAYIVLAGAELNSAIEKARRR